MSFGVGYIYTLYEEGKEDGLHFFNWPPSVVQLNKYLKEKGLKIAGEDVELRVQAEHDSFIENITNRHGAAVAAHYQGDADASVN